MNDNNTTLPPQSIPAEEAVLGAVLIDPEMILNISTFLHPEDFYREKNRWVYAAIVGLYERHEPIDFLTVCNELQRQGQLDDSGGPAYVTGLIAGTPSAVHAEYHARLVERAAVLRRLINAAGKIAALAYGNTADVDEVLGQAEQILFGISQKRVERDLLPISSVLEQYYERIEHLYHHHDAMLGMPTGFDDLDKMLGGLQKSDLIVIASRPSVGKTSLGLAIARHAAMQARRSVAIFSLEMSAEQLVQRMVSAETAIDTQRLRGGGIQTDEWPLLVKAIGNISDLRLFIDDTSAISPMELRTKCRRLYLEQGLDLVIVDYLQLMRWGAKIENRVQEISYITGALKSLARELDVPVVAMAQLSRAVEARLDRHPVLSDLRESGSIEQDADVVMLIYRAAVYYPDATSWAAAFGNVPYPENIAEIAVAKQRNGPTGTVELGFIRPQAKFVNLGGK